MYIFESRPVFAPIGTERVTPEAIDDSEEMVPHVTSAVVGAHVSVAPIVQSDGDTMLQSNAGHQVSGRAADELKDERSARVRFPRSQALVDIAELRKAANEIVPLFAGEDPGAKDCFRANRAAFRSAFTPESYQEFELSVRSGEYSAALEQLRKVTKRHGLSV